MAIINVLGLDGSLQNFGLAVASVDTINNEIVDVKNLVLSKTAKNPSSRRDDDDFLRFSQHWREITDVINYYDIKHIYGEIPSGSRDVRAAFAFGGVTAILAGLSLELPVTTVTPSQVKVAVTGHKHADKEDIIEWAAKTYPKADWILSKRPNKMNISISGQYLTNDNEHLADAIGVIKAGLDK